MHGWINLYKPVGMNSTRAVSIAKRALPKKTKVGHAGTLDPLADGVLPLAIGEATKLIPLLHMDEKAYRFSIVWGYETTTDDREGEITKTSDHRPSQGDIEAILPQFTGTIEQTPPAFSAIKIDGKRAYDRARNGEDIEMPTRDVKILDLTLENHNGTETVLNCVCGTGTYVRSLARDIARALDSAGHVGLLTRTYVGPFDEADTFLLDKSDENVDKEALLGAMLPIDYGLDDILAIDLNAFEEKRVRHGNEVVINSLRAFDDTALLYGVDGLIGIGSINDRLVKPKRVLNI